LFFFENKKKTEKIISNEPLTINTLNADVARHLIMNYEFLIVH
jgi:hypothetical protein